MRQHARLSVLTIALVGSSGCHRNESGKSEATAISSASASAVAVVVDGVPDAGLRATPCGHVECQLFKSSADAFNAALASHPLVLGVGESHALRGTEGVEPATRRFTRDLLPALQGRASDLVIELLLPNPQCEKETKAAATEQKVVTEHQAPTDQNDYVALGKAAKALGIRPHALEPTCDDLKRIAAGGEDAVAASLDVITRLVGELAGRLADDNARENDARAIILYGGALHNDVRPRPGREQWSFGPALQKKTQGRYVELDLVVPEFMSSSPAWQSLGWVHRFDATLHPAETKLLSQSAASFVLVFPRTAAASAE